MALEQEFQTARKNGYQGTRTQFFNKGNTRIRGINEKHKKIRNINEFRNI